MCVFDGKSLVWLYVNEESAGIPWTQIYIQNAESHGLTSHCNVYKIQSIIKSMKDIRINYLNNGRLNTYQTVNEDTPKPKWFVNEIHMLWQQLQMYWLYHIDTLKRQYHIDGKYIYSVMCYCDAQPSISV